MIENLLKKPLKEGDKITVVTMGGMAMTCFQRIIVTGTCDFPYETHGYQGKLSRIGAYKEGQRKRKKYHLDVELTKCFIFMGHDIPVRPDSENSAVSSSCGNFSVSTFSGNACWNFVSELPIDDMRDWIEENCISSPCTDVRASMLYIKYGEHPEYGYPVYPNLPSNHAVIQQVRESHGLNPDGDRECCKAMISIDEFGFFYCKQCFKSVREIPYLNPNGDLDAIEENHDADRELSKKLELFKLA
jgi:hypothetical protein